MTYRSINRLIDWLIGWLIDWLMDWLLHWRIIIDWFFHLVSGRSQVWTRNISTISALPSQGQETNNNLWHFHLRSLFIYFILFLLFYVHKPNDYLIFWLINWLIDWLIDTDWLIDWSIDCSTDWLIESVTDLCMGHRTQMTLNIWQGAITNDVSHITHEYTIPIKTQNDLI